MQTRAQIETTEIGAGAPIRQDAPLATRDLRAVLGAIDDLARLTQARADEACRGVFDLPAAQGAEGSASAMGEAIARIRAQVSPAGSDERSGEAVRLDGERAGRVVGLLDFVEANLGDMMATWSDLDGLRRRIDPPTG